MSDTLYAAATGCSNIYSVQLSTSHGSSFATVEINCETTTLGLGDTLEVNLGYVGSNGKVFTGIVKTIEQEAADGTWRITGNDVLIKAVDYFIASVNPDNPLTYNSIVAETLVSNLMSLAGLTNFQYDATSFTFGVQNPVEINLISSYDFSRSVAEILAWHLYADEDGAVQFRDRRPHIMDGSSLSGRVDSAYVATFDDTNTLAISYIINEKDLRNRVVVYGAEGIYAEASASSPYLPSGFYKTVVAAAWFIDSQSVANAAATYNLDKLNRLGESINITALGDYNAIARKIVYVDSGFISPSPQIWYVFSAEHSWNKDGYIINMELRK